MNDSDFDLSKMSVEDLFRAKEDRRRRLARLSFEEKIEIVKKLQAMSREIRKDKQPDKGDHDTTREEAQR